MGSSFPMSSGRHSSKRTALMRQLPVLARRMIFGTLSESYKRCGQPGCRCHHGGPKHGPHLQISYRSAEGKTSGYHVPVDLTDAARGGVAAWQQFQAVARELAELNRARAWTRHAKRSAR